MSSASPYPISTIQIPSWLPLKALHKLFTILEAEGKCRLVGGCVRDIIMGTVSQDFDIATTVYPQRVLELLQAQGIKCLTVGIEHGTITAIIDGDVFEITTLRKDLECFGRKAKVGYTNSWEEDAARRDFTINAMFIDLNGNIYDYFCGLEDANRRVVRFVGDPAKRIEEDALRVLRYFRFHSYFKGFSIDQPSFKAAQQYSNKLHGLAGERIHKEMLIIFKKQYGLQALELIARAGIFSDIGLETPDIERIKNYKFCSDAMVNLSAILRATENPLLNLDTIRQKWRLSNKEYSTLSVLCEVKDTLPDEFSIKKSLYCIGRNLTLMRLKLEEVERLNNFPLYDFTNESLIPQLPITGADAKDLGAVGPQIKEMISYTTNAWINSNFSLKRNELLELMKAYTNS